MDIAAYLVDGSFDWVEIPTFPSMDAESYEAMPNLLPVLDRCGMFLLLEKVCKTINALIVLKYLTKLIDSLVSLVAYTASSISIDACWAASSTAWSAFLCWEI